MLAAPTVAMVKNTLDQREKQQAQKVSDSIKGLDIDVSGGEVAPAEEQDQEDLAGSPYKRFSMADGQAAPLLASEAQVKHAGARHEITMLDTVEKQHTVSTIPVSPKRPSL